MDAEIQTVKEEANATDGAQEAPPPGLTDAEFESMACDEAYDPFSASDAGGEVKPSKAALAKGKNKEGVASSSTACTGEMEVRV